MKITSVTGHIYSRGFPAQYTDWYKCDPSELFEAQTIKKEVGAAHSGKPRPKLGLSHSKRSSRCYLLGSLDGQRQRRREYLLRSDGYSFAPSQESLRPTNLQSQVLFDHSKGHLRGL